MKKLMILLLIGILLIGVSRADNGFCFVPKISGKIIDSWSNSLVNATTEISSDFGKTPNGYPPYCMTNVSNIKLNSSNFEIDDIVVASIGQNCSLKYEIRKFGYLKSEGFIVINGNQKNYSLDFKLEPNTQINLFEYGTNKTINGQLYVNGNEYNTSNGSLELPLINNILYIFYKGDETHDPSSNITSIDYFWEKNVVNYYVYKKPKINVNFYQDKNITNKGENWNVYININNSKKFSSPTMINYSISGCGIEDSKNVEVPYKTKYQLNYNNNCSIKLRYKVFDNISKQTTEKLITLSHEVSDRYSISYFIKDGYVYAKVTDVNGNPVKTNLSIIYNGKKIKMNYNGTLYYAKIPGNSFEIEAERDGNKGILSITGNFIKKSKVNYGIISLEILLSVITGFWIYKSRKLKR